MARVTRRPLAEADILDIWDYIAEDSLAEADRWLDRLDEKLALWATQPTMGRQRDELAPGIAAFRLAATSCCFSPCQTALMSSACCTRHATSTRRSGRSGRQCSGRLARWASEPPAPQGHPAPNISSAQAG